MVVVVVMFVLVIMIVVVGTSAMRLAKSPPANRTCPAIVELAVGIRV